VTAAGAPVPIAECRSRLGISRQLLDHHARRLSEQGLLLVSVDPQTGERLLAPAPQTLAPKS
jgi:biotin operon repressor